MSLSENPIHLKQDGNRFVNFTIEEALNPKLSSLSIEASIRAMSTPPALATPTPESTPIQLPPGLSSRLIKGADIDRALVFLRQRFFRDEPLNKAINLLETDDDTCEELEDYCLKSLTEELSTMIVDKDDNVVGVGINGTYSRDEVLDDFSIGCENPKFKKILKLLYKVNKESDIFGVLKDVDIVLDMKIISVDEAYRGQGLGHYLLRKANEIAQSKNINVIRCECSSAFSAKVMKKLGSTKFYGLKYEDYKVDGQRVFFPDPPHDEISIYYYRF